MERISDILSRVLREGAPDRRKADRERDWEQEWSRVAGAAANHSYPLGYEKGVLRVRVLNSSWLMELRRREPALREKLEKIGATVEGIVFTR